MSNQNTFHWVREQAQGVYHLDLNSRRFRFEIVDARAFGMIGWEGSTVYNLDKEPAPSDAVHVSSTASKHSLWMESNFWRDEGVLYTDGREEVSTWRYNSIPDAELIFNKPDGQVIMRCTQEDRQLPPQVEVMDMDFPYLGRLLMLSIYFMLTNDMNWWQDILHRRDDPEAQNNLSIV